MCTVVTRKVLYGSDTVMSGNELSHKCKYNVAQYGIQLCIRVLGALCTDYVPTFLNFYVYSPDLYLYYSWSFRAFLDHYRENSVLCISNVNDYLTRHSKQNEKLVHRMHTVNVIWVQVVTKVVHKHVCLWWYRKSFNCSRSRHTLNGTCWRTLVNNGNRL